jgi:hypothetical protein
MGDTKLPPKVGQATVEFAGVSVAHFGGDTTLVLCQVVGPLSRDLKDNFWRFGIDFDRLLILVMFIGPKQLRRSRACTPQAR